MSGKRMLLLIIIISLACFSRDADDVPQNIPEFAGDLLGIFSKHTEFKEIRAQVGALREKYRYMFRNLKFYEYGHLSLHYIQFHNIKRGIPFELQEKMIFDSLTELFGSQPKYEPFHVRFHPYLPIAATHEYYAWYTTKNSGTRCRVSLGIKHEKSSYSRFNKITYLWLKPELMVIKLSIEHSRN